MVGGGGMGVYTECMSMGDIGGWIERQMCFYDVAGFLRFKNNAQCQN